MKTLIFSKSLPLTLNVHVDQSIITKTTLDVSSQGFICQIFDGNEQIFENIHTWLKAYFSKKDPIPLKNLRLAHLTPYTQQVLHHLSQLEFGKTLSYKQLAELSSSPKAFRAVGTICKNNPYPLLIPCHRILASSSLGGFRYGLAIKKKLLSFENIL